jgi:hypothetical protein
MITLVDLANNLCSQTVGVAGTAGTGPTGTTGGGGGAGNTLQASL